MKSLFITLSFVFFANAWGGIALAQQAENVQMEESGEVEAGVSLAPDTLMFSIDDLNEIQSRIAGSGSGGDQDSSAIEDAALYLSTILYYDENDWTAWINGVPIGPGENFQSFTITGIGPSYVDLLIPLSAQGMRPVRLAPNQTFVTDTGAVVEGPWER